MRDLRYGIEIEMTGLSRGKAAETLAGFFGTRAEHTGGSYDAYAVRDAQDRVWKLVSDGSRKRCVGKPFMQTAHTAWSW